MKGLTLLYCATCDFYEENGFTVDREMPSPSIYISKAAGYEESIYAHDGVCYGDGVGYGLEDGEGYVYISYDNGGYTYKTIKGNTGNGYGDGDTNSGGDGFGLGYGSEQGSGSYFDDFDNA